MPKCPREDCDLALVESEFAAPGAWECPVHGGPIWFQTGIQLVSEHINVFDSPTELEFFVSTLNQFSPRPMLSIDRDMAGLEPTVVTVENMPPDVIDVQFLFSSVSGKWLGIRSHIDRRVR